jgi:hypothetical protein
MNAQLFRLKSHLAGWREWEMNPIVIKELRQGVRSWSVTGMLMLFLVVLFVASLGFLITSSFDATANLGLGGTMFSCFVIILAVASMFFIPLYTGVRVAGERAENNMDLLYVTTLSPTRIILGKFLCSAYIVLLFFSACMPFMAFTNLLRGVDLPTVFFILAFLFLFVCAANMVAIFLACLPLSRPFKFLFVLYGIFQSFFVIGSLVALSLELLRSGVGAKMAEPYFWVTSTTVAAVVVAGAGLFFVLSVALISPPSANRALGVRAYITAAWLAGGLLTLYWVWRQSEARLIMVWQTVTYILMFCALLNVISNADRLSLRVRRAIPQPAPGRALAFFFFNGAAGGLCWVAALVALTLLGGNAVLEVKKWMVTVPGGADSGIDLFLSEMRITFLYAFSYALTALFIHRKFLPTRSPKLAGLLALLLAGGWAMAPGIFLFFANRLSRKSIEGLQLGNVFNVLYTRDPSELVWHLYFALGWLVIAIFLNLGWFRQQAGQFRRPTEITLPPVLPPAS